MRDSLDPRLAGLGPGAAVSLITRHGQRNLDWLPSGRSPTTRACGLAADTGSMQALYPPFRRRPSCGRQFSNISPRVRVHFRSKVLGFSQIVDAGSGVVEIQHSMSAGLAHDPSLIRRWHGIIPSDCNCSPQGFVPLCPRTTPAPVKLLGGRRDRKAICVDGVHAGQKLQGSWRAALSAQLGQCRWQGLSRFATRALS